MNNLNPTSSNNTRLYEAPAKRSSSHAAPVKNSASSNVPFPEVVRAHPNQKPPVKSILLHEAPQTRSAQGAQTTAHVVPDKFPAVIILPNSSFFPLTQQVQLVPTALVSYPMNTSSFSSSSSAPVNRNYENLTSQTQTYSSSQEEILFPASKERSNNQPKGN